MPHERVVFLAGSMRAVLGVFGLLILPLVHPTLAAYWWLFVGYLGFVAVEQTLIWKNIGGPTRSFAAGLVDIALLTFLVHRVGSIGTPLIALYFFSGVMNALAVGLTLGLAQAVIASVVYTALIVSESVGWLPYGPDLQEWSQLRTPTLPAALAASAMVATLMFGSTGVVGFLTRAVRSHERELRELSLRDPLTQLYNRRHLLERVEVELTRVRRGHPLALLMIDLDGFKHVNDEQGHLRGDLLLQEIASAFAACTRASDVASRYGGDEFAVLLPDTSEQEARAVAERLVGRARDVGKRFDPTRPVTASLGLALAKPDDAPASILRRADEQAYRAKQGGGDRVATAA